MPPKQHHQQQLQQQQQIENNNNNNIIDHATADTANQLLRDLALIRQKRKQLETKIKASDLVVYSFETALLQLSGSPVPNLMSTSTSINENNNQQQQQTTQQNNNTSTRNNNNRKLTTAGTIRRRNGRAVVDDNDGNNNNSVNDDDSNSNDSNEAATQYLKSKYIPHLSGIKFGDNCEVVGSRSSCNNRNNNNNTPIVNSVHTTDRMFSLTHHAGLANCVKFGAMDAAV